MKPFSLLALFVSVWCLAGCGSKPGNPTESATSFFKQIGEGDVAKAYESTTVTFQLGLPLPSLQLTVKELGLDQPLQCKWEQPEIKNSEVTLKGEITGTDGNQLTATATLVEDRGQWRILSLKLPKRRNSSREAQISTIGKGASFTAIDARDVPSVTVLNRLVKESLTMFNDAIQKRDFREFHQGISATWQRQLSPAKFLSTFQPFIDANINLEPLQTAPIFDVPPEINSEGLLLLNGHIPSTAYRICFTLQFNFEANSWKLFGIDVQIRQ